MISRPTVVLVGAPDALSEQTAAALAHQYLEPTRADITTVTLPSYHDPVIVQGAVAQFRLAGYDVHAVIVAPDSRRGPISPSARAAVAALARRADVARLTIVSHAGESTDLTQTGDLAHRSIAALAAYQAALVAAGHVTTDGPQPTPAGPAARPNPEAETAEWIAARARHGQLTAPDVITAHVIATSPEPGPALTGRTPPSITASRVIADLEDRDQRQHTRFGLGSGLTTRAPEASTVEPTLDPAMTL